MSGVEAGEARIVKCRLPFVIGVLTTGDSGACCRPGCLLVVRSTVRAIDRRRVAATPYLHRSLRKRSEAKVVEIESRGRGRAWSRNPIALVVDSVSRDIAADAGEVRAEAADG